MSQAAENPFSAPQTDPTATGDINGPLGALDHKTIKKLRNASHSIRTIGVLWGLGTIAYAVIGILSIAGVDEYDSRNQPGAMPPVLTGLLGLALSGLLGTAAWSCFTRPTWGRTLGIVLSALSLIGFPLGTLIGALLLYYFIGGKRLYGPDAIRHADISAEYKRRKATRWA